MKTLKSFVTIAVSLSCFNAYAADTQSLEERVAKLETNTTPSQFKNSQVSLYGSFRPSLSYIDNGPNKTWDVTDALSRVGIKSSTMFADGWTAMAHGEWDVDIATGGDFGKVRLAYAAIASPYGQIGIGKQYAPQYSLVAEYVDIFNHRSSPFAYDNDNMFREDNFVNYQLVTGDFTWMAGAKFDGNSSNNDDADIVNIGIGYDLNQLHLGLGYVDQNMTVGDNTSIGAAVAYTFNNDLYLAVSYQDKDYNYDAALPQDHSGSALDAVLAMPISKDYKIKLGYFIFEDGINNTGSKDYDGFNATLEWNPMDNIRVHLEYLAKNYDNQEDNNAVTIGFRYDFDVNWKG